MSELERTVELLKEILRPYHTLTDVREDTILAESGSKKNLYTVKIFPPSMTSVQTVVSDVISTRPSKLIIVSQIEDWLFAMQDALKEANLSVDVERLSPLDIGSMTAGFLPFSEHIGVAVKSIEEAERKFFEVLGIKASGRHKIETEGITASFMWVGSTRVELLEPYKEESAVKSFIDKRGEGIHHIAVEIEDFDRKVEELKSKGYNIIGPRKGATGKRVVFIHPKDFMGILLELVEKGYRSSSLEH